MGVTTIRRHTCISRVIDCTRLFLTWESHGELTPGHLKVLDVDGGAIEKRDLGRLLVGDRERIFEAAVTLLPALP